jgi:hypothetical protein
VALVVPSICPTFASMKVKNGGLAKSSEDSWDDTSRLYRNNAPKYPEGYDAFRASTFARSTPVTSCESDGKPVNALPIALRGRFRNLSQDRMEAQVALIAAIVAVPLFVI